MNRRRFHRHALGGLAAAAPLGLISTAPMLGGAGPAQAQADITEGREFRRLAKPAPVPGHGKVDVVEFFWYGCPACNALEPTLEAWAAKMPPGAILRRMPVVFSALHELHAKMFFALEALGQLETLHRRIFATLHVQRRRLDKLDDVAAFVAEQGVDRAKFIEAFNGFGVATKARQSKQLAEAYAIEGVPAFGVGGLFLTAGSMAGSNERALKVVEALIQRSRRVG